MEMEASEASALQNVAGDAVTEKNLQDEVGDENGSEHPLDSLSAVEKLCKAITEKSDNPETADEGEHEVTNGDCGENGPTGNDGEKTPGMSSEDGKQDEPMEVDAGAATAAAAAAAAAAADSSAPKQGADNGSGSSEKASSPSKMRCSKCSYVTKNKVLFDNHTCDNQEEDNELEEQTLITLSVGEGKKYHCSECDVWAQGHAFEEHLMCHIILRPYQCLYCSECFVNRRDIGRHVVLHHQGMKMNCALRALKRAKGLMKAALETGKYEFYARVAGKVPLQSDPEKAKLSKSEKAKLKKSMADVSSKNSESASSSTSKECSSGSSTQVEPQKEEESIGAQEKESSSDSAVAQGNESPEKEVINDTSTETGAEESTSSKPEDKPESASTGEGEGHSESAASGDVEMPEEKEADTETDKVLEDADKPAEVDPQQNPGDEADADGQVSEREEETMETEEPEAAQHPQETGSSSSRSASAERESVSKTEESPSPESRVDQNGEGEGMGLKIIAAFSLQDEASKDSNSNGSGENSQNGADGKDEGTVTKESQNSSAEPSSQQGSGSGETSAEGRSAEAAEVAGGSEGQKAESSDSAQNLEATSGFRPPSTDSAQTSSFLDPPQASSSSYVSSQVTPVTRASQKNCFFFICGFGCNFSCLTSPEFRDHLILDHAGESSFSCYHCGFQSHSEDGLVRHISAHAHTYSKAAPLYICGASACKFGTNLVADFITHLSSWHPDLTSFRCHDCDAQFWSVQELLQHFDKNFLHIINCPHCTAKATERRTLLNHIAAVHPGKPKMVSVAKQIICRDRKINNYDKYVEMRDQPVSAMEVVPAPSASSVSPAAASAVPRESGDAPTMGTTRNKSLVSILTEPIQPQERELARAAGVVLPDQTIIKSETTDDDEDDGMDEGGDDSFDDDEQGKGQGPGGGHIAFLGSKADEKDADNFKCRFCTFIARDRCRLEGHEKCHGLPPSRKSRFKCMYCPQGFNNEHKFSSHVSCHPGLIKFNLFCCKRCEFDSNQRHIIVKHVRNTRDQAHMSYGANEDDMYAVINKTMETRVLECTQCSYMTRHRKHLVQHIKREHSSPLKTGITVDCDIVEKYPSHSLGANRNKALEMALSHDRSAPLPIGDDGNVRENQARRFKCPICQYLVPRAADLKAHVKRHSEIGEITLVMFRCKYCSAASTAREIIYGHLMEKHLGKQIALVKRIVTIDTKGGDNGYAVTSMEDEEDGTEGTAAIGQKPADGGPSADKMVLLIPDSAGETFQTAMLCPCCPFASYNRKAIIQHVSTHHQEVNIMGRRQDTNEVYPLETSPATPVASAPAARITLGEALKGDILIVPDNQTFEEPVRCPKCDYATIHRRNIVQHLEKNHPDVSVMGRNDYPTFEGKSKEAAEANALGKDGMVIIGSGSLDEKIRCLYENYGDRMKCMICQTERPKKFFIHVHILRHLNILLWKCMYCSHKGLQKYKMMDHIKKVHPGLAVCVRYLPVNVEEKVNEYLRNASVIRARRSGEDPDPAAPAVTTPPRASPQKSSFCSPPSAGPRPSSENLNSCTIGSDDLDMKLACLYALGEGNRYRCVVCGQEFQRRFAVHRHIVQAHLKVNLIGCGYCDLEGVERHIMMDHIIETHRSQPISMRNLAHDLENRVSEFLAKMTLDAEVDLDLPPSDIGMDDDFNFKLPEPPQLPAMLPPLETSSPPPTPRVTPPPSRTPPPSSGKNQLNPKLLLLGRDTLHTHLKCLIDETNYNSMRCLVCSWDFPRKYAAHRHILMKHLKVGIIGCPYCSFEGVERYQVFTHIKEDHKDAELSLRYLSVDMDKVVREFMANLASGKTSNTSSSLPPWSVRKPITAIKTEASSDGEDGDSEKSSSGSAAGQGLVVAMFSKKSTPTIKEEPMDDDEAYGGQSSEVDAGDMEDSVGEDNSTDYDMSDQMRDEREVQSMSLMAANGTKAKSATDVLTNIRVITIKERGFKRHVCEKCKFTSLHRSNIVRHIYRVHEQYREQECPVCNYKTLSRVLIQQHMRNEHPGTPFPEGLAKPLKRKPEQSSADMEHDSIKRCKAAATSRRREGEVPVFTSGSSGSSQLYACAYCSFETSTHAEIVQHTRDNHSLGEPMKPDEPDQSEEVGTEDMEFETLSASAVKMNQVDLSNGAEDSLLQCFYCAYKTTTEDDLRVHFSDSHPGLVFKSKKVPAWRFVCRSCNVKTRAHSKMRYHLNRHINYRPYTCTTCGAFFPSPDQCRKHCRANNHNETFTYVKIPRKEKRLQELLKECQEIAQALTNTPGDFDFSSFPSSSTSSIPPSKRKAKKSFSSSLRGVPGKLRRSYEYDAPYTARVSAPGREEKREDEAQMVCASCDFTAQNVCDVWLHFIKEHEMQEFQWMDMTTGHICTETGEITNAKDVPPDLEEPEGPGYSTLSNRLLTCHSCEFTTATVQAMKSHLRRHLPKRFLCPYCSLRCSRRDTITQHVKCAHKGREIWIIHFRLPEGFVRDNGEEQNVEHQFETVGDMEVVIPTRGVNEERIKCSICDFKQQNVALVYEHFTQEHQDEDFRWIDMNNGYTCTYSGEVLDAKEQTPDLFSDEGFLVESSSGNVPTFTCKLCSFNSAFIQAMKSHMKSHLPHGFMCPYCNLCTNSRDKMVSHQTCAHRDRPSWVLHLRMPMDSTSGGGTEKMAPPTRRVTGVVNYSCNLCEYNSENLYQYRLHLANHGIFSHLVKDTTEDLPFKCGYCVYVAEDEGDFGAHIASHLERRNYRCSKCEYTAFKRSAVLQHIQSTHDETEEVEVIDLQAENVSEQGGSVEEPKLVNFQAVVSMSPVKDEDLEKEGLSLYTPPDSPEDGVTPLSGGFRVEFDDADIIGLDSPSIKDLEGDDVSDSTEEWGTAMDESRESTPAPSGETTNRQQSLLRATLQGRLTEIGQQKSLSSENKGDEVYAESDPVINDPVENEAMLEATEEEMDEVDGVRTLSPPEDSIDDEPDSDAAANRNEGGGDSGKGSEVGNVFTNLNSWLDK